MLSPSSRYGRAILFNRTITLSVNGQARIFGVRQQHTATPRDAAARKLPEEVRGLMRHVTQPVVLVTTAYETPTGTIQRGLTVSSFTTICLYPTPAICFSTRANSRAAELIAKREQFIVHLLPSLRESAEIAEAFSKSDLAPHVTNFQDPFRLSKWTFNEKWKFPVMDNILGALLCRMEKTVDIGDHQLLIAKVEDIVKGQENTEALSYSGRRYRRQGEPIWPHDPEQDE